jgi:hypothetical protein
MTPKGFVVDEVDATCDVCGVRFCRKFGYDLAGKFVCTLCSRYRHVVHAFRFVEYIAQRDCEQTYGRANDDNDRGIYCKLDCGCDPCSARKVLKFIEGWQKAHGRKPVYRP